MSKKKIVKTRQSLAWTIIDMFLSEFNDMGMFQKDEEFKRLFQTLTDYVTSKLALPYYGDITREYVVVEQEITIE